MCENEGLISIIIPVYNVKDYLDECVNSIMKQTYNNIEIILVDDGSCDGSENMCDFYSTLDNRIKVIHKSNGGLSDARNVGLLHARGEYIGFVDSDDFVEANMYEELMSLSIQYDVDLVCARYDYAGDQSEYSLPVANGDIICMTGQEFLYFLIAGSDSIVSSYSVWDRLYKKSLIEKLSFPVGLCYEDVVFSTKAIINSERLVYLNKCLYHYRIRKGSISHGYDKGYDKRLISDRLPLQKEQIFWLESKGYNQLANIVKATYYQEYLKMLVINKYPEYETLIRETLKTMRLGICNIMGLNADLAYKIKLIVKMLMPELVMKKYKK